MVENKNDFEYERVASIEAHPDVDNPPLVNAEVVVAHPQPSAPVEEPVPPPSYEEVVFENDIRQGTAPSTSTESNVPESNETKEMERQMVAAGTTAAVFGFLFLGGPIGATILGFTTAYASQKDGAAGDIARSVGDIGVSIKEKAKQINHKHHIVDRSSRAATEAWTSAKEYDRQHRIMDKIIRALQCGWEHFTQFVKEHRLLERGVETAGRGFEFVADRVSSGNSSSATNSSGSSPAAGTSTQRSNGTSQKYRKIPVTVPASTY